MKFIIANKKSVGIKWIYDLRQSRTDVRGRFVFQQIQDERWWEEFLKDLETMIVNDNASDWIL